MNKYTEIKNEDNSSTESSDDSSDEEYDEELITTIYPVHYIGCLCVTADDYIFHTDRAGLWKGSVDGSAPPVQVMNTDSITALCALQSPYVLIGWDDQKVSVWDHIAEQVILTCPMPYCLDNIQVLRTNDQLEQTMIQILVVGSQSVCKLVDLTGRKYGTCLSRVLRNRFNTISWRRSITMKSELAGWWVWKNHYYGGTQANPMWEMTTISEEEYSAVSPTDPIWIRQERSRISVYSIIDGRQLGQIRIDPAFGTAKLEFTADGSQLIYGGLSDHALLWGDSQNECVINRIDIRRFLLTVWDEHRALLTPAETYFPNEIVNIICSYTCPVNRWLDGYE